MPRRPSARPPLPLPLLLPQLLLLLQLLLAEAVQGVPTNVQPFCSRNLKHGRTGLEWSKGFNKKVTEEVTRSAHLSCCINNARNFNITWYITKDGKTDVLPDSSSSFDRFEDDRQTLRSLEVQTTDKGNYTCVVSNGTDSISETIEFIPTESAVEKIITPINLNVKNITYAEVGSKAVLECRIAKNTAVATGAMDEAVVWQRMLPSKGPQRFFGSAGKSGGDPRILIQKFSIDPVTKEDFGIYRCCIIRNGTCVSNTNWTVEIKEGLDPDMLYHPAFLPKLVALLVVALLLVVAFAAGARWHLELRLFCKDRFGHVEDRDDKEYDIFVCYDKADTQFVIETLVRVLEDNFGYTCYVWQRDTLAGDWIPEAIVSSVCRSRRFLMVISPALAENPWCTFALYTAIDAMLHLHSRIICVLLKDVEWSRSQVPAASYPNPTLKQVLRIVRKVVWKRAKDRTVSHKHRLFTSNMLLQRHMLCISKVPEKEPQSSEELGTGSIQFWRRLRLYLPPKRSLPLLSKPPESPTSTKSLISLHMET